MSIKHEYANMGMPTSEYLALKYEKVCISLCTVFKWSSGGNIT